MFCSDSDTQPFPVRLGGGSNPNEGRIEVFFKNTWGIVCDNSCDDREAKVVCRQLGLPYTNARAVGGSTFGTESGPIWLDNLQCFGTESSLDQCIRYGWGYYAYNVHCSRGEHLCGVVCTEGV